MQCLMFFMRCRR